MGNNYKIPLIVLDEGLQELERPLKENGIKVLYFHFQAQEEYTIHHPAILGGRAILTTRARSGLFERKQIADGYDMITIPNDKLDAQVIADAIKKMGQEHDNLLEVGWRLDIDDSGNAHFTELTKTERISFDCEVELKGNRITATCETEVDFYIENSQIMLLGVGPYFIIYHEGEEIDEQLKPEEIDRIKAKAFEQVKQKHESKADPIKD